MKEQKALNGACGVRDAEDWKCLVVAGCARGSACEQIAAPRLKSYRHTGYHC